MNSQPFSLESVLHDYAAAPANRRRDALRAFKSALDGKTTEDGAHTRKLATKRQVAEYFQRSPRWVDIQADAGRLPRLRTPGAKRGVRFRWSDVYEFEASMLVEVEQ